MEFLEFKNILKPEKRFKTMSIFISNTTAMFVAFIQLTIVFAAGPWPGIPIPDLREPTQDEINSHMPPGWQTCDMELDLTCPNHNIRQDGTPEQIYHQRTRIARLRWLRSTYGNDVMRKDSSFRDYMTKQALGGRRI